MAIKIPAKLLKIAVQTQAGVDRWPYNDGQGDKWWEGGQNPRFYTWELELVVTEQGHSSHLTREPFTYNAFDIKVGDWIANSNTGIALRVIGTTSKSSTTATIIVEDVNRYNTFRDSQSIGNGALGLGNALLFTLNEEGEPLLDTLSVAYVSDVFFPNVMGRFQNLNAEYDFNLTQIGNTFAIGDLIAADTDNNQWVKATTSYNYTVGRVSALGPSPDQFYITPITRVINDLTSLPGDIASLLYIDDADPGKVTTVKNDHIKYIKLINETPTNITGDVTPIATVATGQMKLNGTTLSFPIGDAVDVITVINSNTIATGVSATQSPSPTETTFNIADQPYGTMACLGDGVIATINGITVSFNVTVSGTVQFGTVAANAEDMVVAILRDVTSIDPNISAYEFNGNLFITHALGNSISLLTINVDDSGYPFAGLLSCTGIIPITPSNPSTFLHLENVDAGPIILEDILGTPSIDLGIFTVENGRKAAALYVEQGIAEASSTVVANIAGRDALDPGVGDQAMVLDQGNGEWELYLYDGGAWVVIANQDSARTDANSIEFTLDFNSPASNTMLTVSNESRITLITIEVLVPFDGTPILTIGDGVDPASLFGDDLHDLSELGTYASQTDTYYNPGSDTDIIATYNSAGVTTGQAKIIVSYM